MKETKQTSQAATKGKKAPYDFMKDKKGQPLNPAMKAVTPKKYGAMGQH